MRVAKSKDPSGPFIKRRHAILETDWAQYGKVRGCAGSAGLLSLWCCRGQHGSVLVTALSCRLEVPGGCSTTPGARTPWPASSRADNCSSTGRYHIFIVTPETGSTKYKVNPQDPLEKRLARLGHTQSAAETCSSPLLVLISCQSQKTSFTIRKIKHHKHELIIDFFGVPVLFPIYSGGSQHQLLHVNNWGLKDHHEHKGNGGGQG